MTLKGTSSIQRQNVIVNIDKAGFFREEKRGGGEGGISVVWVLLYYYSCLFIQNNLAHFVSVLWNRGKTTAMRRILVPWVAIYNTEKKNVKGIYE